jgi:fructokinase
MGVASLGELLIDFVALENGVSVGEASGFEKAPGGAPANVAVGVSRLGHPSAFLTQLGDDPFGRYLAEVLAREGVNMDGVRYTDQARTALAFVALADEGERSFVFYRHPSADMLLAPEAINTAVIDQHAIFHFGSITLIDDPVRSATLHAAEHARRMGKLISYDPNLRLALWPDADSAREGMLLGLEYANILKVSDEEVAFMTGGTDARALWREATQLIVVTHGKDGVTAYTREDEQHVEGFTVEPVDTTGAGDGFVAGLLTGILDHDMAYQDALPEILRFANAVGALATTKRGAIPALPTREQATALMQQG